MKTVIVKTEKEALNYISVFSDLPNIWIKDDTRYVVTTESSSFLIEDSKILTPFDLVVKHTVKYSYNDLSYLIPVIRGEGYIEVCRIGKDLQQAWIVKKLKNRDFDKLRIVPTWSSPVGVVCDSDKSYVLKNKFGARGMGHVVFSGRNANTEIARYCVNDYIKDSKGNSSVSKDKKSHQLSALGVSQEVFVTVGTEFDTKEHIGEMTFSSQCLTEKIENITHEFRVITNYAGNPVFVALRDRNIVVKNPSIEYSQATGRNSKKKTYFTTRSDLVDLLSKDKKGAMSSVVSALLQAIEGIACLGLPVHSLDVFIAKCPQKGHVWGIFEFSPEFGRFGIPSGLAMNLGKEFIENLSQGE